MRERERQKGILSGTRAVVKARAGVKEKNETARKRSLSRNALRRIARSAFKKRAIAEMRRE